MNYEQKYKDALERAKQALKDGTITNTAIAYLQNIFPELVDNKDERIRKWCVNLIKTTCDYDSPTSRKEVDDAIAWLEKQGEKHLENYGEAEKEKADFVSNGFIECHADFLDFKEGETYWLEYIGDDKYNVRSDNLLGKTYHITPCQLYTVFKKLTWLEKQNEPKPQDKTALEAIKEEKVDNQNCVKSTDNVAPKFHKDEWITNGDYTWKIVEVKPLDYVLQSQDGNVVDDTISYVDEHFHYFTIKDVKDGDVLCSGQIILLFKEWEYSDYNFVIAYAGIDVSDKLQITNQHWLISNYALPATKEQRDTLMKAITDAGYTFDFDKKELKKIENEIEIPLGAKDSELQEATYYIPKGFHAEIEGDKVVIKKSEKPTTWSEEDEKMLKIINTLLFKTSVNIGLGTIGCPYDDARDWLKDLKQRLTNKQ